MFQLRDLFVRYTHVELYVNNIHICASKETPIRFLIINTH